MSLKLSNPFFIYKYYYFYFFLHSCLHDPFPGRLFLCRIKKRFPNFQNSDIGYFKLIAGQKSYLTSRLIYYIFVIINLNT